MDRCLNCNVPIRLINYAMGKRWMHVNPDASFPTEQKGTAWTYCKQKVAEPVTPSAVIDTSRVVRSAEGGPVNQESLRRLRPAEANPAPGKSVEDEARRRCDEYRANLPGHVSTEAHWRDFVQLIRAQRAGCTHSAHEGCGVCCGCGHREVHTMWWLGCLDPGKTHLTPPGATDIKKPKPTPKPSRGGR